MGKGIFRPVFIGIFTHFPNSAIPHDAFPLVVNIFPLYLDADKQPAYSLSKVAAFNVEDLLLKSSEISSGAIYNICQLLLKEWGPGSLGTLPKDSIQEFLIEVMRSI